MRFVLGKRLFFALKIAFLAFFCLILWILLTFDLSLPTLVTGTVYSLITALLVHSYFYKNEILRRYRFLYRFDLLFLYLIILIFQSYTASFQLIYQMITRKNTPGIVRIRTRLKSKISRAILANTITLIPGTMTLWLEGRFLYVHCFDIPHSHSVIAGNIIKGKQERLLGKLFG
ncbi:Na+/H+ antiporter subunit E [Chitinivibrio alkaliphilus]|uniref:Putative monovalent cation/H+ antiporter subunit E n=1 Tax=Chitinivibrio alkaliphilus ACht1 TaxID=1313304 RepID=U7D4S9_9BACT|nr:Na+/H+ antiporter subunit E [Chitinivibrio alkaliphilus]ERP30943.1 putative monovalent cation/H+ antiporter subunit E [Chitinivibrio alkaliphilus ACht1]